MTSKVMPQFLKIYYVSIHRNFYQIWFINECARKKKAKIPESHSLLFFVRTYNILNKDHASLCRKHIFVFNKKTFSNK